MNKKSNMGTQKMKMKNILYLAAVLSAVATGAQSCSVKEDRVPCPCYLNVSFQDKEKIDGTVGILAWADDEVFRVGLHNVKQYNPYWIKAVHKGVFDMAAYRGVRGVREDGHTVIIPKGSQSDSLYAYYTDVDATGEMAYADVAFKKQFATVTVDICRTAEEMPDFTFLVKGNTCGFDLLSFDAVSGEFEFAPVPVQGERTVSFRVPRQVDDSMTLQLWRRGETAGKYPLGEYIKRVGYDWSTEELHDVRILIDLVIGQVTIAVEGWESGAVFQIIKQ